MLTLLRTVSVNLSPGSDPTYDVGLGYFVGFFGVFF